MSNDSSNTNGKSRGIYLLPNLFTTAGLFSGFYAIVASMNDRFIEAAVAIFIAMVFDGLDGRVARMTNTESDFGAEFDSMADIVSFGMAPALVMYNYALADLGKIGWLAAFIFVAGGALRLARFNTNLGSSDKNFFQGLAIPSAAAIVAGLVWVGAFKDVDWKGKVSFLVILVIVLVFVIVATQPSLVLFSIFFLYALSGPVLTIKNVKKLKLGHVVGDDDEDDADFNDNKETKKEAEKAEKED